MNWVCPLSEVHICYFHSYQHSTQWEGATLAAVLWQGLALRMVWPLKLHWLIPVWGISVGSPSVQQKYLLQSWEVQHRPAGDIHQLECTAGFSCTELQRQLCLHLVLPWDWESCKLHRHFPSAQLPKVSAGAVQTGTAQLCLDEWLAFKTHSRQGPWQTASEDVCFDFPHL